MNRFFARYQNDIVLLCSLLALWPVFHWYALRMFDGSDESFGLLALITALGFVLTSRRADEGETIPLKSITILLGVYILGYFFLPPILRAAIAVTLLGLLLSQRYLGSRLHTGLWGLLLLSLPVVASMQFYLGYPLRWLVGQLAGRLLQLNGLAVTHAGAVLNWPGGTVSIDAPCSGIKMLWFGLYLSVTLACVYRLDTVKLIGLSALTVLVIIAANTLRATTLFYIESGFIATPAWTHDGAGVLMFLLAAAAIVWLAGRLKTRQMPCGA